MIADTSQRNLKRSTLFRVDPHFVEPDYTASHRWNIVNPRLRDGEIDRLEAQHDRHLLRHLLAEIAIRFLADVDIEAVAAGLDGLVERRIVDPGKVASA